MEAYVDKRKRPSWVPKTAVTWDYRIVTKGTRLSPVPAKYRTYGCSRSISDPNASTHMVLKYPKGRVVHSKYCSCDEGCCAGIGFFLGMAEAIRFRANPFRQFLRPDTIIVRCYVPRGGKYVLRKGDWHAKGIDLKGRANKLVTL